MSGAVRAGSHFCCVLYVCGSSPTHIYMFIDLSLDRTEMWFRMGGSALHMHNHIHYQDLVHHFHYHSCYLSFVDIISTRGLGGGAAVLGVGTVCGGLCRGLTA